MTSTSETSAPASAAVIETTSKVTAVHIDGLVGVFDGCFSCGFCTDY